MMIPSIKHYFKREETRWCLTIEISLTPCHSLWNSGNQWPKIHHLQWNDTFHPREVVISIHVGTENKCLQCHQLNVVNDSCALVPSRVYRLASSCHIVLVVHIEWDVHCRSSINKSTLC